MYVLSRHIRCARRCANSVYFETVARRKSFTRAAEELRLARPTVTVQIKQLSDALEQPLFERIGKKVFLTDAGRELYEACKEVF